MMESNLVRRLAALLTGRPLTRDSYRLDDLLLGIASESARLGARPYLLSLYQQVYDYEGLTEHVFLLDSFDSLAEAIEATNAAASRIIELNTSAPDRYGNKWGLELEGKIHFLPKPPPGNPLEAVFTRTFKLRGSAYDTEYSCLRIIGEFSGPVVGEELFQYIGKTFELWSYFVECGASVRLGSSRPSPLHEEEIQDGSNAASAGEVDQHALDEELEQTLQDLAKFAEEHNEALDRIQPQEKLGFDQQSSRETAASPRQPIKQALAKKYPNHKGPLDQDADRLADSQVKNGVKNRDQRAPEENPESEKQQRRKGNDHSLLNAPNVLKPETVKAVMRGPMRMWQIADRWASGWPKKVKEMEAAGTLLPRLKEQAELEISTISDARVGGAYNDTPDSDILALYDIPLLLDDEADDDASSSQDDDEVSESPGYLALKEMVRAWGEPLDEDDRLAGVHSREDAGPPFSVLIMDMFHYGDPDEEVTVSGFKTLEEAREYARRRTRDSLEELRSETTSATELRDRWFAYGEDCIVIHGDYAGGKELDYFIQHPATDAERDWKSLTPS